MLLRQDGDARKVLGLVPGMFLKWESGIPPLQCHHWKMVPHNFLILLRFWGWHWGGVPYIPHDVFEGYAGNDGDWCLPRFGSLGIHVEDYFKMRDLSIFLKGSLRSNIQFGSFTI